MEIFQHPESIRIEEYDYSLPEDRIAQFPLETRDHSKLMIYKDGQISEDLFYNLPGHLPANCLMVFNETRVVHARLLFQKESGSHIEIFCLEPLWPFTDHLQAFQQRKETQWKCLVGNSKRWKSGKIETESFHNGLKVKLSAERLEKSEVGISRIRFTWFPEDLVFGEVLETTGKIPLPPYIQRQAVNRDEQTYQTIYARQDGSVAAPTAGLHFSENVMKSLGAINADILKFTLHVGAGTFRPVVSDNLAGHEMHAEQVYLPVDSLERLLESLQKPIIAVGTTTTRLLESLYWHGVKVIHGLSEAKEMDVKQWDPYGELRQPDISRESALEAVIRGCKSSGSEVLQGKTSLLIAPGYQFRFPDILITNFHQPKSTLLLLIAAFIGDEWKKSYQFALANEFRFLSYGDSCLFQKTEK